MSNRKVAMLIAVLALFLSLSETLGKSAQTESISANVEAANLWAFFQAKTIRRTVVTTAAEEMKIAAAAKAAMPPRRRWPSRSTIGRRRRRATGRSRRRKKARRS